MIRQQTRLRMPVDIWLFAVTLALVVIGLWMVFDSSYPKALDNPRMGYDAFYFVKQQARGAIVGLAGLFTMMRYGYWNLKRNAVLWMIGGAGLLCAVYLPHVGVHENNAARWLKFGPIVFQASEVAKLALVIYAASFLSRAHCNVRSLGEQGLAPLLLVGGIYILLIEREPDLGTAAVLFLAFMTQLFLAGARKRHIGLLLGVSGLAAIIMVMGFGHRRDRIAVYLHPEKYLSGPGYQPYHSIQGVGSGGLTGFGLGQGREKYFLPQGNSDFIFVTYAEELGLVGSYILLGLQCMVSWRGFRIAQQTKDPFGSLLAAGIAALVSWQALVNLGTATGSIPATGVTLPFISNGSTSLVLLLASVGILLNIAQHPMPPAQTPPTKKTYNHN
jgi:cell division protein FtsW